MGTTSDNVLLLSIDEQHIERIYREEKHFELRKQIPKDPFSTVWLYQTKGEGIVGWFEVNKIRRLPLDDLWKVVGRAGSTKSRFDKYFQGYKKGCAIEIGRRIRLKETVSIAALKRVFPNFRPPLSSQVIRDDHTLSPFLHALKKSAESERLSRVRLFPLSMRSRSRFRELVLKEIGRNYDGIDNSFVDGILKSHEVGRDRHGFFTVSKEALTIKNSSGKIVGFTTITYKSGLSAKTGPTIILEDLRRKGIGQDVRKSLEARIVRRGYRKIYCTAPSLGKEVVGYLLKSDYRIEAHLEKQYSTSHDEFVFGKVLFAPPSEALPNLGIGLLDDYQIVFDPESSLKSTVSGLTSLLSSSWFRMDSDTASRIAREVCSKPSAHDPKPKTCVLLKRKKKVYGAVLLLPKRGGSMKALVALDQSVSNYFGHLLTAACNKALDMGARRFYLLHPITDDSRHLSLRKWGFKPEGLLDTPYVDTQDVIVYGKKL